MEFDFENESQETLPGFEQTQTQEPDDPLFRHQTLEESLASLYKPPYPRKQEEPTELPSVEPTHEAPIFPDNKSSLLATYEEPEPIHETPQEPTSKKADIMPLALLAVGANLLTLGVLLFFFSEGGLLTLQFNASKWFLYCLFSIPLLYLGLRQIRQLHPDQG